MSKNKHNASFFLKILKILVPLMLILAGGAAWSYFKATAPVMERITPQRQVTVVDVETVHRGDAATVVSAMGTVVAARQVTLKAQVSGVVQWVSDRFIPGGLIAKGKKLLSLEPADYQVAVKKAQSALKDAQAALAIEQGSQNIAREELRLLSELSGEAVTQTDLALRKPHLAQARADVTSAEADLRQAQLNLNRTKLRVPFNAMIVERNVNLGAYVGVQDTLATIVGTDRFWIEAVVSLDQLSLIDLDHPDGCPAAVRSQSGGGSWQGRVIQVVGKLNESSRMATVIVAVKDPLGTAKNPSAPRLMIDDYVQVEITGRTIEDVIQLPRTALKDGNRVWINHNDTLDIRDVALAWKSTDKVYVESGVASGEQVVMSSLSTPVQGMPLKTVQEQPDGSAGAPKRDTP